MITPARRAWCFVIGWMAVIFWFSGAGFSAAHTAPMLGPLLMRLFPAITPELIESVHFAIRKLGHWTEYFVLAVLLLRALTVERSAASMRRQTAISILGAMLFALSDEWHQSFVPGREASLADVTLDSFGALCGATLYALLKTRKSQQSRSISAAGGAAKNLTMRE